MTPETPSNSQRDKPVILVAEDAGIQVRLAQICLERANFTVVAARDGVEALQKVADEMPDLIIMDVEMPEMNGFQALDKLRNDPKFQHIPVLMLTAHAKDSGLFDEWATSADAFMTKPFSPLELVSAVQALLQTSAELPVSNV